MVESEKVTSRPLKFEDIRESECSCGECTNMCKRPCWPTPAQAEKLITAGYASRLCLDYYEGSGIGGAVEIVGPALKGHEGEHAPFWPIQDQGCSFWVEGLCQLHNEGLKPLEGCLGHHLIEDAMIVHGHIPKLWDNDEGRQVVQQWRELVNLNEDREEPDIFDPLF